MKIFLKNKKTIDLAVALGLISLAVLARFLPHPPNFTPIAALALFSAYYLPKKIALALPVLAMFISDIFIGFYNWPIMSAVYASFLLIGFLGLIFKRHKKWRVIGSLAVGGAVLFFLTTNFAVWAFTPWYSKDLLGLSQCFMLALPFFKNTLLGNIVYTGIFFGIFEIINQAYANRRFAKIKSC